MLKCIFLFLECKNDAIIPDLYEFKPDQFCRVEARDHGFIV